MTTAPQEDRAAPPASSGQGSPVAQGTAPPQFQSLTSSLSTTPDPSPRPEPTPYDPSSRPERSEAERPLYPAAEPDPSPNLSSRPERSEADRSLHSATELVSSPNPSSRPERSEAERSLHSAAEPDPSRQTQTAPPTTFSAPRIAPPSFPCDAEDCSALRTEAADPILHDAQKRWAARPISDRLQVFRGARHWIAAHPEAFLQAISPDLARTEADTVMTELLPLLDAIRFLERNAQKLLAPKVLGSKGRPLWFTGVRSEVHRDPLGHVLIIGPSNFPLMLTGVQAAQALVAGNAVTWKPGLGGQHVALLFAHALREAGLPRGILSVTGESVEAAQQALAAHPDKVVFTGSFDSGRKVLRTLAETATPATMELSGADPVIVLPSADLNVVAKAVTFGLRLNGGEVCMSPRRLIATPETLTRLRPLLQAELANVPPVPLKPRTATLLRSLLEDATTKGATVHASSLAPIPSSRPGRNAGFPTSSFAGMESGAESPLYSVPEPQTSQDNTPAQTRPILIDHATPEMAVTRTDVFAPVLSLIEAPTVLHLAQIANDCPYALTATIFGNVREARALATEIRAGCVVVNDLIAPIADPRVPFGGRGQSGFGVTQGAEGLLEMTVPKALLVRRKGMTLHYDPVGSADVPLLSALIGAMHGGTLSGRWRSLLKVIAEGRKRGPARKRT